MTPAEGFLCPQDGAPPQEQSEELPLAPHLLFESHSLSPGICVGVPRTRAPGRSCSVLLTSLLQLLPRDLRLPVHRCPSSQIFVQVDVIAAVIPESFISTEEASVGIHITARNHLEGVRACPIPKVSWIPRPHPLWASSILSRKPVSSLLLEQNLGPGAIGKGRDF